MRDITIKISRDKPELDILRVLVACKQRTPDGYILCAPGVLFPGVDARKDSIVYDTIGELINKGFLERYWFITRSNGYGSPVRGMLLRINLANPGLDKPWMGGIAEAERAARREFSESN